MSKTVQQSKNQVNCLVVLIQGIIINIANMTCMMTYIVGIFPRCDDQEELLVKSISNDEYRKLVRSLNEKQRQFFYHVLHSVKTSNDPLRHLTQ